MACPAGVEPATYGLEGLKNLGTQYSTMIYSALVSGVHFGSDFVGLDGVSCGGYGIHRCLPEMLAFYHMTVLNQYKCGLDSNQPDIAHTSWYRRFLDFE